MTMRPEKLKMARGSLKVVKNNHAGGAPTVWFDFNPAKISTTAQAKWEQKAKPGSKAAPEPTFTGSEPQTMELELTLDEWSPNRLDTTVEEDIATLISWTRPAGATRTATKPSPPLVELKWGPTWFVSYVTSVKTTINMFDEDGHALRATVAVSLKELPKGGKGPNPTSGSRVGHQSHSVLAGDSLASVAQNYYDKPSYWRGIALANDIDDPRQLRPGSRLYLPPLTDVAALS